MAGVDDVEGEAELALQFVAPLAGHRGRGEDDGIIDAAAQQHLAQHQPGLDRLAQAHIVGDQQVDARQAQRLA